MYQLKRLDIGAAGLAIFSMFFGAGNIIFPLALGHYALDQTFYGILGLLITAVGIPFAGLYAMFLYQGDVRSFFGRIGAGPGLILALVIISLLGPLGSTPRCIALAYSTFNLTFPGMPPTLFNALACLLVFLFAYKKNRLLDLLGYVLTPILVILLVLIVIKGLWEAPVLGQTVNQSSMQIFLHGLNEGYNTMDLLAAFFFAPVILSSLQKKLGEFPQANLNISGWFLRASLIGAALLATIYVGFGYLASYYASRMGDVSSDQLLAMIAQHVLGPYAGIIVGITVVLACLTTAIALIAAFTEFLHKEIFAEKISENALMIGSLLLTFLIASLEFQGISRFLTPVLQMFYPALIVLTGFNLLQKFKQVRNRKMDD